MFFVVFFVVVVSIYFFLRVSWLTCLLLSISQVVECTICQINYRGPEFKENQYQFALSSLYFRSVVSDKVTMEDMMVIVSIAGSQA